MSEKRAPSEEHEPSRSASRKLAKTQECQAKRREVEERQAKERDDRESRERAEPTYPIRLFCLQLDEMPWVPGWGSGASDNYGFGTRDLSVAVAAPNDALERVNNTTLPRGFSYLDLAAAIEWAAFDEGACGMICRVDNVYLDQDQVTLRIEFDIRAFDDGEGGDDG